MLLRVLLLVLAAPAVFAQQRQPGPPPPQDPQAATAALLRSADATEQAWGAWYAGRDQLRQFVPELHPIVMSRLGDETLAGHAAVSIALDALIQLGGGAGLSIGCGGSAWRQDCRHGPRTT
jgi:hypothetical protein